MKLPQGKIRFASVFLFMLLTANFLMAQALKQHVDNPGQTAMDPVPDDITHSHHGNPNQTLAAVPGPIGEAVSTGHGINYHNGPVMKGTPNVYVIWYGNWNSTGSNTAATRSAIEHFLGTIGGSALELVNSTYGDTTGNVTGQVRFGGSTIVSSSTNLSDTSLRTTVSNAISSGALPRDSNGVYFVLSSSNINETSGFCTQYCGFHTHASLGGTDIKYSFVGNVDRCPSGCEAQRTGPNSPAADVGGVDGMANVISHELEEAISDPDLNAWFDSSGQENADKCNFNFGARPPAHPPAFAVRQGKQLLPSSTSPLAATIICFSRTGATLAAGACAQHL